MQQYSSLWNAYFHMKTEIDLIQEILGGITLLVVAIISVDFQHTTTSYKQNHMIKCSIGNIYNILDSKNTHVILVI